MWCYYLNENFSVVLSHGAICFVGRSIAVSESMDEFLRCDHSNETLRADHELLYGTIVFGI